MGIVGKGEFVMFVEERFPGSGYTELGVEAVG